MTRSTGGRSVSDRVFQQLRDQIVSGALRAGSQLPGERILSEEFGVNRGAVREALKRLSQAGLVSTQHGGGTRVLDYRASAAVDLLAQLLVGPDGAADAAVVRSLTELHTAVAPEVARLAARRATPQVRAGLRVLAEEMQKASGLPDPGVRIAALRREFWGLLLEGCDSLAFQLVFNTLLEGYGRVRHLVIGMLGPVVYEVDVFARIADAVSRRDEDAAERATREETRTIAGAILRSLEGSASPPRAAGSSVEP